MHDDAKRTEDKEAFAWRRKQMVDDMISRVTSLYTSSTSAKFLLTSGYCDFLSREAD